MSRASPPKLILRLALVAGPPSPPYPGVPLPAYGLAAPVEGSTRNTISVHPSATKQESRCVGDQGLWTLDRGRKSKWADGVGRGIDLQDGAIINYVEVSCGIERNIKGASQARARCRAARDAENGEPEASDGSDCLGSPIHPSDARALNLSDEEISSAVERNARGGDAKNERSALVAGPPSPPVPPPAMVLIKCVPASTLRIRLLFPSAI